MTVNQVAIVVESMMSGFAREDIFIERKISKKSPKACRAVRTRKWQGLVEGG